MRRPLRAALEHRCTAAGFGPVVAGHPPGMESPTELLGLFAGRRVIVAGDLMLDEWRHVEPERLAREAPAPVVTLRERRDAAGGAGNTAVNLAALGARPVLVGLVGADAAGDRLSRCLTGAGVDDHTVRLDGYATPVKRRLLAGDQIVVREDEGTGTLGSTPGIAQRVLNSLRAVSRSTAYPVLVLCDYGLGALEDPVRGWLVANRDRFATVALDAHDLRPWRRLSPTLVTPSFAEAIRILDGPTPVHDPDRVSATLAVISDLVAASGADTVAVTLDAEGAVVANRSGHTHRTMTGPVSPSHTVGAGDVYLAAITLAVSAGAPLRVAAELAQLAAGCSVSDAGTCVCDLGALTTAVDRATPAPGDKVVDSRTLIRRIRELRGRGARVVFTNGCFDVLHRGHVGYLEQGSRLGDVLVVAVNSDRSVRRLKGPDRPVNRVEDRTAVLAALSCVDYIVVFDQDSPSELIEAVQPNVYIKGGDYPPELVPEAPQVRRLGGEVHILGYIADRSTSAIIERIRNPVHPVAAPDGQTSAGG